ncbi:peroxidasin [Caerostris extrusa]|uniref:Peroxidasin n=1 Tax=Caerostris extrusa TaxID=172846 RepID=A0AAV4WUA6_CAEEX|nr:peroxidasin [Caerostris extrusa]
MPQLQFVEEPCGFHQIVKKATARQGTKEPNPESIPPHASTLSYFVDTTTSSAKSLARLIQHRPSTIHNIRSLLFLTFFQRLCRRRASTSFQAHSTPSTDPELDASIVPTSTAHLQHDMDIPSFQEESPKSILTTEERGRDLVKRLLLHTIRIQIRDSDDIRNYLYRRLYLNQSAGLDLAAASITYRGRDHGIAGYTYYLNYLFNITIYTFNDLRKMLPPKSVDLPGRPFMRGFVGPTFGAILGQQYKRVKFGDRYWFEHASQAGSFTPEQLVEIKRTSLARILCETTRIRKIQMEPFETLHQIQNRADQEIASVIYVC